MCTLTGVLRAPFFFHHNIDKEFPMRVNGRILRPATLAERRFLFSLGTSALRVPRRYNPYVIARRLGRAASGGDDVLFAREIAASTRPRLPVPSPGVDTPESPRDASDGAEG